MKKSEQLFSMAAAALAIALVCLSPSGCARQESAASSPRKAGSVPALEAEPLQEDLFLVETDRAFVPAGEQETNAIQALVAASSETGAAKVTVDYPKEGTLFPPDIVAPTVLWHDSAEKADRWLLDVSFEGNEHHMYILAEGLPAPEPEIDPEASGEANELYVPTEYQASAKTLRPSPEAWETIKKNSLGRETVLKVYGFARESAPAVLSAGQARFETSTDPVGAPIFYRDVPLLPSQTKEGVIKPLDPGAVPLISWRLKSIGKEGSRLLLHDMPTCANCHSFSADGATLGMDVDGPNGDKGAYAIVPIARTTVINADDVISWNRFKDRPKGLNTFGFLSRMSPDGRYTVSTVNEALYVRNFQDYRFSQVFFPTRGILVWHDRETGEIKALPGADDPKYVHCDGVWSPDGKWIVFARAEAGEPYLPGHKLATYAGDPNERQLKYDLYRIPFNGGKGGTPEPIEGASANGMSNTFPKVSPDGKWIVYTKCRNGQLMRPDGKLWIVPFEGGEARQLACSLPLMNSWHSFSPNGKWLVFSSKSHTPYTQMFLSHLDETGHSSPAVLIDNATVSNRAVNIPEFVNIDFDDLQKIDVPAVDHWRHFIRGAALAEDGNHEAAVEEYRLALKGEQHDWRSNDWKTHANMSISLMALGDVDGAMKHIQRSLELHPNNPEMYTNYAYLLLEKGVPEQALENLDQAVELNPKDASSWFNRATIKMNLGDGPGAIHDYDRAIRLDPNRADAYNGRGMVRKATGDLEGALTDFDQAIRLDPSIATGWYFRATIKKEQGDLEGAKADLQEALKRMPPEDAHRRSVKGLLVQVQAELEG